MGIRGIMPEPPSDGQVAGSAAREYRNAEGLADTDLVARQLVGATDVGAAHVIALGDLGDRVVLFDAAAQQTVEVLGSGVVVSEDGYLSIVGRSKDVSGQWRSFILEPGGHPEALPRAKRRGA